MIQVADREKRTQMARPAHATDHRRWLVLAVALTGTFLVIGGVSIVNLAMPSMQRTLNASFGEIELVVAAYTLVYAIFLIAGGRLGDIVGRKRVLMAGLAIITIGLVAGGLAPNATTLIGARVLQGFGSALLYPQILSIIEETFEGGERSLALGLFGATIGVALVAGQLIGGVLIQLDLGGLAWRPAMLVLAPVSTAALVAAAVVMSDTRSEGRPTLDYGGTVILGAALALLILPLLIGREAGWPLWLVAMLVASFPVFALFVWYEGRVERTGGHPLLTLGLFRQRAFATGIAIGLVYFVTALGFFVYTSVTLQIGLGFTALQAGLASAPSGVAFFFASLVAPRLVPGLGRHVLSLGYVILLAGMLAILASVHAAGTGLTVWTLAPALLIVGTGQGLAVSTLIGAVLSGIRPEDTGAAAGALTTSFQLGQTLGIALVGMVFFLAVGAEPAGTSHATRYLFAYQVTLPLLAGLAILLLLLVFLLPRPAPVARSNVFLERAPSHLHGLVHSFYFATGGRAGDHLMEHILRHHMAETLHHEASLGALQVEETPRETGEFLVHQFEHPGHSPTWHRYLLEEALVVGAGGPIPHETERRAVIDRQVAEVRDRQRERLIDPEFDAAALRLMAFALTHCPQLLPQITRMTTGHAPDSPEFHEQWDRFLRQLGARLSSSD
ncbi:MAG TPA: MFS transporter [Candidatus Dormibacteraeota bacterium]